MGVRGERQGRTDTGQRRVSVRKMIEAVSVWWETPPARVSEPPSPLFSIARVPYPALFHACRATFAQASASAGNAASLSPTHTSSQRRPLQRPPHIHVAVTSGCLLVTSCPRQWPNQCHRLRCQLSLRHCGSGMIWRGLRSRAALTMGGVVRACVW